MAFQETLPVEFRVTFRAQFDVLGELLHDPVEDGVHENRIVQAGNVKGTGVSAAAFAG